MKRIQLIIIILSIFVFEYPLKAQWIQANKTASDNFSSSACLGTNAFAVSGTNLFSGNPGKGIFLSKDNGINWTEVNTGLSNKNVTSLAIFDTNIFAGTSGGGIFISTNNGTNWTQSSLSGVNVMSIVVCGQRIYAGASDKVYVSTDNGNSWTQTYFYPNSCIISGTTLFAGNQGIYSSTDEGSTWNLINASSYMNITSMTINGNGHGGYNLFAAGDSGVSISTDNGSNWVQVNNGFPEYRYINCIAATGANLLASSYGYGLYISTNNGTNWVKAALPNNITYSLTVLGSKIIAGTDKGLFISGNNGVDWKRVDTALANSSVTSFAANGKNSFASSWGNGLFISSNSGISWTNASLTNKYVFSLSSSGANIFAGTDSGVVISTDNGTSWIKSGLTDNKIISIISAGGNIIAAPNNGGVILSTDNGKNWSKSGLSSVVVNSFAISNSNIFAGTSDGVYISTNNGVSWSQTNLVNTYIHTLAVSDSNIYADIFYSSNNGNSWKTMGFPDNSGVISIAATGTNVFAGTSTGIIYQSSNNGTSWNQISSGLPVNSPVNALAITDTNLIAGFSGNGVWFRPIAELAAQNFSINFNTPSFWPDSNFDGKESGTIAPIIKSDYGSVSKYEWNIGDKIIGTSPSVTVSLPTGTWYIGLTLTGDRGSVKKDSVQINVYAAQSALSGSIESGVSQLNDNEFFVTSKGGSVYCFDSTGNASWTIQTGGSIQSTTCISNKDNIYVGSNDTRLYSFDYQGIPRWDKAMGGTIVSSPSVLDSLIYVGVSTGRVFALDENSNIKWFIQTGGQITSSASINSNGVAYIGSNDGKLYAISPAGTVLWNYATGKAVNTSPALGLDSSIVFGSNDGFLYKLDWNGNLKWNFQTGGQIKSSPVIGLNGSIYFGSGDGKFYCLSKEGNKLWEFNANSAINTTPALNTDGTIYFGTMNGIVYALDSDGNKKWMLKTGNPIIAPMLVTKSNIIMVGDTLGKLYIMKIPADSSIQQINNNIVFSNTNSDESSFEWWTFKGNNQRTGYRKDILTGINKQTNNIPVAYSLSQNYPNPFNPTTNIKYSIPKSGLLTIKIYDMLGREVKTLVNEIKSAGNYSVQFNGSFLPSGIYFYRMQSGNFSQTKKLILLK